MTTAWDRIDQGFRDYLAKLGYNAEEYDRESAKDRTTLFDGYERYQNQKQQQPRRRQRQQADGEKCVFGFALFVYHMLNY